MKFKEKKYYPKAEAKQLIKHRRERRGTDSKVHKSANLRDVRSTYERDRDRILHSSAFRRLAHVSQVVPSTDGHLLHSRQAHSFKVSLLAVDIVNRIVDQTDRELLREVAGSLGGLHPMAAAAGGLAHDLGHPPFAHSGEKALQSLVQAHGDKDSFEGNAQTLRVLAVRAVQKTSSSGLLLSHAALNASQKYPWPRKLNKNKWGYYTTEAADFGDYRQGLGLGLRRCLEAEVVDLADDLTFAAHDLEDFIRTNTVPINAILRADKKSARIQALIAETADRMHDQARLKAWMMADGKPLTGANGGAGDEIVGAVTEKQPFSKLKCYPDDEDEYGASHSWQRRAAESGWDELVRLLPDLDGMGTYESTQYGRANLRGAISELMKRVLDGVFIKEGEGLVLDSESNGLLAAAHTLTKEFVVRHKRMARVEAAQKAIISRLFGYWFELLVEGKQPFGTVDLNVNLFPYRMREAIDAAISGDDRETPRLRLVVDSICSLTDEQAIRFDAELTGRQVTPFFGVDLA